MAPPNTTGNAQLVNINLVAERDAETRPDITEKTTLMEVYTTTEEAIGAGVGGTRKAHLPLGQSSPPWLSRIGTSVLLLVVPLTYIGRIQAPDS
jgi:hypothetical protein